MTENVELNSQIMTGSAQTMLTWVRVLQSKEEIPQHYLQDIESLQLNDPLPYTLLVPLLKNQRNKPAERLLILVDKTLHVFEKRGKKIIADEMVLHPGIDLEMGNALLYSWITFRETDLNTSPHTIMIPFNTATARHMDPIIHLVKPAKNPENQVADQQALTNADYKYNAFVRECISKDTQIIGSLWQPPLKKRMFQLFGKAFYQNITLAHYSILTSHEFIYLWDDENSIENRGVRYGGIRRNIPRTLIRALSVNNHDNLTCQLTVYLHSGEKIHLLFAQENISQVKQFIQDFQFTVSRK